MKNYLLLTALVLFVHCTKEKTTENSEIATQTESLADSRGQKSEPSMSNVGKEQNLKNLNDSLLKIFEDKNYGELANFIHPTKGVLFSMYGYVDPTRDKRFTKEDYLQYLPTPTKFTWGEKDGTGDLLVISLKDYLSDWVYSRNFSTGAYYLNTFKGSGNTLNNLEKVFPGTDFTENYIAGSEKYGGMNWNTLRFVFEQFEGQYYLIAVINDSWTI